MELLYWAPVERKRNKNASYGSPDFVRGYDLDVEDMHRLILKFNGGSLDVAEQGRLMDHVLTLINIVFEHRDFSPTSLSEKEAVADGMFIDIWGAFKHITPERKPYSYLYRCGFTAGKRYYAKLYREREKQAAIREHLDSCYEEYLAEATDAKVPCRRP